MRDISAFFYCVNLSKQNMEKIARIDGVNSPMVSCSQNFDDIKYINKAIANYPN